MVLHHVSIGEAPKAKGRRGASSSKTRQESPPPLCLFPVHPFRVGVSFYVDDCSPLLRTEVLADDCSHTIKRSFIIIYLFSIFNINSMASSKALLLVSRISNFIFWMSCLSAKFKVFALTNSLGAAHIVETSRDQIQTMYSFPQAADSMEDGSWSSIDNGEQKPKIIRNLFSLNSRRRFLVEVAVSTTLLPLMASAEEELAPSKKVLVLGGTGLVGSEVVRQLKSIPNVDIIATSTNGRDGTIALDVTRPGVDVAGEVERLAKGCLAVISTIGAFPTSPDATNIIKINAASGYAAVGAKAAGVKHFVFIGNAPEVKTLMIQNPGNLLGFLQPYVEGKSISEEMVQRNFGTGEEGLSFTVIKPTFIYGGDKFGLSPPRVNTSYGQLVESLLSLGPFRAASSVLPGFLGIALEPPVSAEAVARATIVGAFSDQSLTFDTHDAIVNAGRGRVASASI
jgi:hypothetical protein